MVRMSAYCKVITADGQPAAFLIALSDGAPYDSCKSDAVPRPV